MAQRSETWSSICAFLAVAEPDPAVWNHEANTSPSTKGSVAKMRQGSRLPWRKLSRSCREIAERLGYRES